MLGEEKDRGRASTAKDQGKRRTEEVAFNLESAVEGCGEATEPCHKKRGVLLMMLTGMRVSEALVLKISDNEPKGSVRHCAPDLEWPQDKRESTKTDEPRTIPLSYLARDLLSKGDWRPGWERLAVPETESAGMALSQKRRIKGMARHGSRGYAEGCHAEELCDDLQGRGNGLRKIQEY